MKIWGSDRLPSLSGRVISLALVAVVLLLPLHSHAGGTFRSPRFGPFIEGMPEYDGQSKCSPNAKPGVVAFERMVMSKYPDTSSFGISRGCNIGGTSEHKEGRAWDWGVNAADAGDRAKAKAVIDWLLATDRFGNENAMARRLGVMYLIWNRRIWMPYRGWTTYCVERKAGCVEPGTKNDVRSPHTDHVHFSFTWGGARKQQTFWHPEQSLVSDIDSLSYDSAFWSVGRNGTVASSSGDWTLGGKGSGVLKHPIADMASTSTGGGYWLLSKNGRVSSFGDAAKKGSVRLKRFVAAAIAGTPTARGYWVLGKGGRVIPFGDAVSYGDTRMRKDVAVSIAPTPTGLGYWLVSDTGKVSAFGDAVARGELRLEPGSVVAMDSTPSGLGYWIATEEGRVASFGDARSHGDLRGEEPTSPIVAMAATPSGLGYWLVSAHGRISKFGDARAVDARIIAPSRSASVRVGTGGVLPGE